MGSVFRSRAITALLLLFSLELFGTLFGELSDPLAQAGPRAPIVIYLTDIEGKYQKVVDYLRGNRGIVYDAQKKKWLIRPGYVFVYGGDATDTGEGDDQTLAFLNQLRADNPGKTVYLGGNRELNKVVILHELSPSRMHQIPPDYREWLGTKQIPETQDSQALRLKWLFDVNVLNVKKGFEGKRKAIAEQTHAPVGQVSDDEVTQAILRELGEGGSRREFLSSTVIAHRQGNLLFVHGGVTEENVLQIPGEAPAANVDEWVSRLNSWYTTRVKAYRDGVTLPGEEWPGQQLYDYARGKNGTKVNQESAVIGRYSNKTGNPEFPAKVEDILVRDGIQLVVSGHTPYGDVPILLRALRMGGMMVADNTMANHASYVELRDDRVFVRTQVNLDGEPAKPVVYSFAWGNPRDPHGTRIDGTHKLIVGRLENGDYLAYQVVKIQGPKPEFKSEYTRVPRAQLAKLKLVYPYAGEARECVITGLENAIAP